MLMNPNFVEENCMYILQKNDFFFLQCIDYDITPVNFKLPFGTKNKNVNYKCCYLENYT